MRAPARRVVVVAVALAALSRAPSPRRAVADTASSIDGALPTCTDELAARGVSFRRVKLRGVADAVELTGVVGGLALEYRQPLILDCSLAVSLDEAGRYLRALGVSALRIASGYSRRNVRGTNRPSKHSFGLAVDVPSLEGPQLGVIRVDADYEQGLGDGADCIGAPVTARGALLRIAVCQLVRSGLFSLVLSPDYDDAHHDHLHLEALPWSARRQLRSDSPAIH